MTAYVDDRVNGDSDTPDPDRSHGYVMFSENDNVRVGYIGGVGDPDSDDPHVTVRHAPYLFPANWRNPNAQQILEAWDVLVKTRRAGFAEAEEADPTVVRLISERVNLVEIKKSHLRAMGRADVFEDA